MRLSLTTPSPIALGGIVFSATAALASSQTFYSMRVYSPRQPLIDNKVINAAGRHFAIGPSSPETYCDLDDPSQCPDGSTTLVDADMTQLASSVPGGQFVFVAPDGTISYPSAHSARRPPGAQMGGFYTSRLTSDCAVAMTVLAWQSDDGAVGLWACPSSPGVPLAKEAVLKASTRAFGGWGCLPVEGVQLTPEGHDYAAWAYT